MLRQEHLKRVHLLRDALDVVEAVNANDDLDAREALLKLRYPRLHLGFLETLFTMSVRLVPFRSWI
jgi:hypothetical protein